MLELREFVDNSNFVFLFYLKSCQLSSAIKHIIMCMANEEKHTHTKQKEEKK